MLDLWRAERSEVRKLEEIPEEELDDVLCRFYAEIRQQNGDEYEPDSLAVMQGSLDRNLKNNGKSYSILRDRKNNWIQKIPRTAKLDEAESNLEVLGIFLIQLFPNWTGCSPITCTN